MKKLLKNGAALVFAALTLAACESTPGTPPKPAEKPEETINMASPADQATCVNAVGAQANNSATVISSTTAQVSTIVIVGVGTQKAPWKCVINKGKVVEVMSLTNEGAL